MKKIVLITAAALAIPFVTGSCTTTYDAYGRPVQSVNPGTAAAAAVAAGVIGYALADDDRRVYNVHPQRRHFHQNQFNPYNPYPYPARW